ncbi:urea transporter [Pseudomonas aeruginosa]
MRVEPPLVLSDGWGRKYGAASPSIREDLLVGPWPPSRTPMAGHGHSRPPVQLLPEVFFFLERPACMTLAWPSRPGCVASAPDPTMTAPAPRAGLASPCSCRAALAAPTAMPLQSLLNASRILLRGISQVFLQGDPRLGPGLSAGDRRRRRRCSPAALLGSARPVAGAPVACADSDIEAGLYGYNAVLIGMLLAFRFAWSPGLVSLVALGCLASVALQRLFLHGRADAAGFRPIPWASSSTAGGWCLVGAWLGLAPATHGGCFSCAWSGTAELAALAQGIGEIIFLGEPLAGCWSGSACCWSRVLGRLGLSRRRGQPAAGLAAGLRLGERARRVLTA